MPGSLSRRFARMAIGGRVGPKTLSGGHENPLRGSLGGGLFPMRLSRNQTFWLSRDLKSRDLGDLIDLADEYSFAKRSRQQNERQKPPERVGIPSSGFRPLGRAESEEPLPPAVARPPLQGIGGGFVVDERVALGQAQERLDELRAEDGLPAPTPAMLAHRPGMAGTVLPDLVGQRGPGVRGRVGASGVARRVPSIACARCRPPTPEPFQPRRPSAWSGRVRAVLRAPVRHRGRRRPK